VKVLTRDKGSGGASNPDREPRHSPPQRAVPKAAEEEAEFAAGILKLDQPTAIESVPLPKGALRVDRKWSPAATVEAEWSRSGGEEVQKPADDRQVLHELKVFRRARGPFEVPELMGDQRGDPRKDRHC
jgi:hypothetical protein